MNKKLQIKTINLLDGSTASKDFNADLSKINSNLSKNTLRVVNWQLCSRRSGSANVKDMSQISGTTKKPFKQKGTGGARQGSKRSVQFVGGRTCHGPKSRDFSYSLPKKIVKQSCEHVIYSKLADNKVLLSENSSKITTSTSNLFKMLKKNNVDSALVVANQEEDSQLFLSLSNLKNIKAIDCKAINAYDLLKYDYLIISEDFLQKKLGVANNV